MKVSFFGASVTQQKEGYTNYVKTRRPEETTFIHGYGSMHLFDAGICFIDDILLNKPDICFIDWFSTGYKSTDPSWYLNTIVYKFTKASCRLVFLFLDRNPLEDDRIAMYDSVKLYCKKYGIPYLELYNNPNISEMLRDNIHTTLIGAEVYGRRILEWLASADVSYPFPTNIKETSLCAIKSVSYDTIVKEQIEFSGEGKLIGLYMSVGPFSHKVEVMTDTTTKEYVIRDQWCHYERKTIHLSQMSFKGKVVIRVVDPYGLFYLKPHMFFYIGDLTLGVSK